MTGKGLLQLEDELRKLKSEERPAVIRAIAEARSHGDLSENAEYHAARERQSFIEGRILELEELISTAEVIEPTSFPASRSSSGPLCALWTKIRTRKLRTRLLACTKQTSNSIKISISSPLAKALIGKEEGDTVSVPAPGGDRTYEILSVKFI